MSVKSSPLQSKKKDSAIISRATLDKQRGAFERFSALGVLFFSFAGTVAACSGGWSALMTAPRVAPIAGGLVLQLVLTATEYWYGAGRGPWRYRIALVIDAVLTTLGYGALIVPWLTPYLAERVAASIAPVLAWGLIGVLSFLIAWYPERTLID